MANIAIQKWKNYFRHNRDIKKEVLIFTMPLIAENMLMSLISVINSSMVGHLGAYALASVGLTNQPVFIFTAVFQSFNVGATALIARFIGSNDLKSAKIVMMQTLFVSSLTGALLAALGFIYAHQIVVFMGAQPDTVEPAAMYMRYMAVGAFFQAVPLAVASILRGAGRSTPPMVYNITANVVNVIVGAILIHGLFGLPMLGLEGAAISATASKGVACIMSIVILFMSPYPIHLSFRDRFRLDFRMLKRILNISLSAAGEQLVMRIGFLVYAKTIAELGTVSMAAHVIITNITGLVSNVVSGLGIAASSFAGRALGAKDAKRAVSYVNEIETMGFIFSLSIGVLFIALGRQFAALFTSDAAVIALSAEVLVIGGFLTFPQNIQVVLAGALRGAGDTVWPLITAMVTIMLCRVGLAIVFVHVFHWGLVGAWGAALFDQSLRAVIIRYRYKKGGWKSIEV